MRREKPSQDHTVDEERNNMNYQLSDLGAQHKPMPIAVCNQYTLLIYCQKEAVTPVLFID